MVSTRHDFKRLISVGEITDQSLLPLENGELLESPNPKPQTPFWNTNLNGKFSLRSLNGISGGLFIHNEYQANSIVYRIAFLQVLYLQFAVYIFTYAVGVVQSDAG